MMILALVFAAAAVSVWWHPLSVPAQFIALMLVAAAMLAIRSAWKRLDRAHAAAVEAKRLLNEARNGDEADYTGRTGP